MNKIKSIIKGASRRHFLLAACCFCLAICLLGFASKSRPNVYIKTLKNSHYQLMVNKKPYIIKGACYNPIPVGENHEYDWWQDPNKPWIVDGKLMKEMGINTIRIYQCGADPESAKKVISDLYNLYGIRTIMGNWLGFWEYPCPFYGNKKFQDKVKAEVLEMVRLYKDEPGILLWILGNENNYSCLGRVNPWSTEEVDKEPDPQKKNALRAKIYYSFVNDIAKEIHKADANHPVALGNGELTGLEFAKDYCADIDLLACIIYRGKTFGNLFRSLRMTFDRPILLAEFGADCYNAKLQKEDQDIQAFFLEAQWRQIYENLANKRSGAGNCIGGTIFEWTDEWWKYGESNPDAWKEHDTESNWSNGSYYFDIEAEGNKNMNEEWFGIVALSPEKEFGLNKRIPRKAYYVVREFWKDPDLKKKENSKCLNSKSQIPNPKTEIKLFVICALVLFCYLCFGICYSFGQGEENKVALSKEILEAESTQDTYQAFEDLTDLYFAQNQYNEYANFLQSLAAQKKSLEPVVNYYIGLTRYYQLKYLEETQNWNEYFNQGNTYRGQLTSSLEKAMRSIGAQDVLGVYTRLILWKYYKDSQDELSEPTLSNLYNAVLAYAEDAVNLVPIKLVADELSSYGEKGKAKELYKVYVNKLISSDVKNDELLEIASSFYKEGNLDLAENIYDVYIERLEKSGDKDKLNLALIDTAKLFSYKDGAACDLPYAQEIFAKIEKIAGKGAFNEELMYLRAFNLEKEKDFILAKDAYLDLIKKFPASSHADEAAFKVAVIYTYILRDPKEGKAYFEKLAKKETIGPQVISSIYQLGLLSQWGSDIEKAKEYYAKLLKKAGSDFADTVVLAKERLKEIDEEKPIEYGLKLFLDTSLKEEYAMHDMTKSNLKSSAYKLNKGQNASVASGAHMPASGCMQVELQYLWSGDTGKAKPSNSQPSFSTSFASSGTKVINLVVVSASGIIDRNLDLVDVN